MLLAAVLLVGCGGDPEPGVAGTAVGVAVYSEFLPFAEVEAALPDLADAGVGLRLAVAAAEVADGEAEALASVLRAAEAEGVEVGIWLLLADEDGYWPGETNVGPFGEAVTALLDWLDAEGLAADAVVFDLEPDRAYSEEILGATSAGELGALVDLLGMHVDAGAHAAARRGFQDIVDEVHASGRRALAVTYPQVLDDGNDGDLDLEDAFDIPVDGVGWDEVSFMVYQSVYEPIAGEWVGPDLVYTYAETAVERFGDRATVALGIVGQAGVFMEDAVPYADPAMLADDVAAAAAAGARRVEVYSLDGALAEGGVAPWLALSPVTEAVPEPSTTTGIVRSFFAGVDSALDR